MQNLWRPHKFVLVLSMFVFLYLAIAKTKAEENTKMKKERIQIYTENPRYWQYKGEPILLIGGSVYDELG